MPICRRCQELKADSDFYESHPRNCKRCVYLRKMELIAIMLDQEEKRKQPQRHPTPKLVDITNMESKAISFAYENRYNACKNPYLPQVISLTDDFLASREQNWRKS